jgi:hypothetical protein
MASEKNSGGRNLASSCLVCSVSGAKYKFRCCQKPFCSQKCFKEHSECPNGEAAISIQAEQRVVRTNNYDLNLTDDEILTEEIYDRVRSDTELLRMLSHPRVQLLLLRLNNSRDRRRTLKRMSSTSALFANLVERIESIVSAGDNFIDE